MPSIVRMLYDKSFIQKRIELVSTITQGPLQIGRSTAKGAAISVGMQGLQLILQLLNVAVLSRLLPPADFGLVAMSASAIAFVNLFRDFGLSTATVQRPSLDQDTASGIFIINIGVSLSLALLACLAAPVAAAALDDPRAAAATAALSATIPMAAFGAQHSAQLTRQMRFFTTHSISVTGAALGSMSAILLAVYGAGYWALIANTWISTISQSALLWTWSPWRPTKVRNWAGTRSALGFGITLTGSGFITYLSRQFDKLLIGWRWGGAELGYYSRAYTILMLPQTLISGPISSALVPGLCRLQSQSQEWRELLLNAIRITTLFTFLVSALLIVNADDIVAILLGPQWERSADLVTIFGISMIARAVMNQNPWIYISLGHTKRMLRWQLATLPAFLLGIGVGLFFGAEGVATGFSLVQAILCVPSVLVAASGTPIHGKDILRVVTPMFLVTLATIVISPIFLIDTEIKSVNMLSSLLNICATSAVFAAGAVLVLWLDPAYGVLRNKLLEQGQFWILGGRANKRENPSL